MQAANRGWQTGLEGQQKGRLFAAANTGGLSGRQSSGHGHRATGQAHLVDSVLSHSACQKPSVTPLAPAGSQAAPVAGTLATEGGRSFKRTPLGVPGHAGRPADGLPALSRPTGNAPVPPVHHSPGPDLPSSPASRNRILQ